MTESALPIIDLSLLDGGIESATRFRAQLLAATHDVGFFYLVGHGIEQALMDDLLAASREFFALTDEQKFAVENVHSAQFRGYTRMGGELTEGKTDLREQIDVGPERPLIAAGAGVADYWRLEGPNLWPAAVPQLRNLVNEWNDKLSAVSLRLLRAWAEALGAPNDVFDAAFADNPFPVMKIVRYPGESNSTPKQGVGAHRDGGVLTLLMVEPGKDGLQVQRDGDWVDVAPMPGAFVVNIGEMLELATQGYLTATLHRVISPRIGDDRISIPFFFNPALDTVMPQLHLPPELAAQARGVSSDPSNSPILETYGDNALRYRMRAHPNVASIHHDDLIQAPRGAI
ncbi:MAG: isopenicillin N synthase family dioxygenase [Rhodoglobus sp.]